MNTVVGIFTSHDDARRAARALDQLGVRPDRTSVLLPGASERELADVPTTEGEAPGVGRVVGGAAGASGGMQAAAVIGGVVPGVGPVLMLGAIGAALFGLGGMVAGGALDEAMHEGLPCDDLYLYEDAFRRGYERGAARRGGPGRKRAA